MFVARLHFAKFKLFHGCYVDYFEEIRLLAHVQARNLTFSIIFHNCFIIGFFFSALFIDSLVSFHPLPLPAVLSLALFSSRFLLRPSSRPRFVVAGCLFFRRYIVSRKARRKKGKKKEKHCSRPGDALKRRYSSFRDWIPSV